MSSPHYVFVVCILAFIHQASSVRSAHSKQESHHALQRLQDLQHARSVSYGQLLRNLREADQCESTEDLERGKCLRDEALGAFATGLRENSCKHPESRQLSEEFEELCQAAEGFDPTKESDLKAMSQALEKIQAKLKDSQSKVLDKLAQKNGYLKQVAKFLGVKLSRNSEDALPIVGDSLELMSKLAKEDRELTTNDAAVFALQGLRLAVRLAGPLIPIPGLALLADKVIEFAINRLAAEAEESLEEMSNSAKSAHRALTAQKLREAKIFLDAAHGQIGFQTAIDDSFTKDGKLENEQLSFNRWLILENALAQAIPRVLVPDRSDASEQGKSGQILKVEDRADFMTVIFDHFLVYILVLSRLEDRATQNPVLRGRLVKRAHEMGKIVMPNLAVMWEKQWDNPSVEEFKTNWNGYDFVFDDGTKERWRAFQKAYDVYEADVLKKVGQKYGARLKDAYRTDFQARLATLLSNRIYLPKEAAVPEWCFEEKKQSVANFIVKCLWHPLYHSPFVQLVEDDNHFLKDQMEFSEWSFDHCNAGNSQRCQEQARCSNCSNFYAQTCDAVTDRKSRLCPSKELQPLTSLSCSPGEVISMLELRVDKTWTGRTATAKAHCSKITGFSLVENTLYTFDMSKIGWRTTSLNLQSLCAHDYAVLLKVEFRGEAMISTCQYAVATP